MLPTQPAALGLHSTLHTDASPLVRLSAAQHTLRYSHAHSPVQGQDAKGNVRSSTSPDKGSLAKKMKTNSTGGFRDMKSEEDKVR